MSAPILSTRHVTFSYGGRIVLDDINLDVAAGQFVGLIGPNGSGKSTLIKLLAGLFPPQSGEVLLHDRPLARLSRREAARSISVVPQEVSFHFPFSVQQVVMMGRHPYQGLTARERAEDKEAVAQAMAFAGVEALASRSVTELSGGEKQRVILAAAIAQAPDVLLLDEPTASLDLHYQVEIYSRLKQLNRERGVTIFSVTHDLNLGAMYCDRLLLMANGQLAEDLPPEEMITPAIIERYYGVTVLDGHHADGRPFAVPTIAKGADK